MSRYEKTVGKYQHAWGYDHMLSEYFYQKFDLSKDEEEDALVFSVASYISEKPLTEGKMKHTNSEILEIMEDEGVVPENHKDRVAMDLPF